MSNTHARRRSLGLAAFALLAISAGAVYSQTAAPTNSSPNPYRSIENAAKMPPGRTWGSTAGVCDRSRRHQRVGCGALRRQFLRRLESRPDAQIRRLRKPGEELRRRDVRISARHLRRRDGNVWVTDGQGKDGKGHQVFKFSPDGKVLLTLGKAGDCGRRSGQVQRAVRGSGRAQRRHLRRRRPRRQHQFPHREVLQGRQVHQDLGEERHRARRVRHPAHARHGFARTPVRRRPQQQPHPDLRPGRQIHRPVAAVQPSERRLSSTRTTSSMSPIPNPNPSPRITTAGSGAFASARRPTDRLPPSFPTPSKRPPAPVRPKA